jgi:7-cyano-7-deazaguanine synthase
MQSVPQQSRSAVVLLSGGLDSATTLAIARSEGFECFALSFDYGQRHRFELDAARRVARSIGVRDHIVLTIDLRAFGGSALTADIDVPKDQIAVGQQANVMDARALIPITYVPARNTIFLSFALAWAEVLNAADIYIGVNAIDYSGYPDCRPAYIDAFQRMANLATRMGAQGVRVAIHTPLINLTKSQIIQRGLALGVDYSLTFSCYDPEARSGKPCGHCDACLLRAAGFREAGLSDPAAAATP